MFKSPSGKMDEGCGVLKGVNRDAATPSPLDWLAQQCLSEDSINVSRQLRSHRSKLPKWANPQRSTAPLRLLAPPHPGYFLLTHASVCRLHFDAASGGSLKCKMVNKCALMGNTFISLTPICPGRGAYFQKVSRRNWCLCLCGGNCLMATCGVAQHKLAGGRERRK